MQRMIPKHKRKRPNVEYQPHFLQVRLLPPYFATNDSSTFTTSSSLWLCPQPTSKTTPSCRHPSRTNGRTNLAAEHCRRRLRQTGSALEAAVADELLHGGDVDVPFLGTGVHPRGVDVHAHHVLGDAAVALLIPAVPRQPVTAGINLIDRIIEGRESKKNTSASVKRVPLKAA